MITQERSGIDEQIDNLPPLIFNQIPFPGKDQQGSFLKNYEDGEVFVVNYSTLNTSEKDKPYAYERFEIFFPDEILASAAGKTRSLKVSFTINADNVRTDVRSNDNGDSIVRTANMIIPDSDQAQQMVLEFVKYFEPISGVQEALRESGIVQKDEVIIPFNSGSPCDSVIETIWEYCEYLV